MRRGWMGVGFLILIPAVCRAGLYDPQQPTSPLVSESGIRALPFDLFRDALTDVLRIADPLQARGARAKYLERRSALLARSLGTLSPNELAELGLVQWRLRDADGALTALRLGGGRDPRNFWVQSNLGTVYQAMGQLREAAEYLETARTFFPDPWPGGPPGTGPWFKQAERYQAALLRLRLGEGAERTGGRTPAAADVDALFPVRFVGPTGQYEPGKLADDQQAKLPADAVAIVQQLLLWFPSDTRLLWLLGELYNARGDLSAADAVFEECVWSRRYDSVTLREHRRLVKAALAARPKESPPDQPPPKPVILPDTWQLWTVGLIAGALFAVLGYFQVRELLRRRRSPVPPSV
jgi:tetratricopeptide (TPR) repeat protein